MNLRIRSLLERYDTLLEANGVGLERAENFVPPEGSLQHLRWMIREMREKGLLWSDRKVNRWLGFIQGTLWSAEMIGILDLRDDSRDLYDPIPPKRKPADPNCEWCQGKGVRLASAWGHSTGVECGCTYDKEPQPVSSP